MEPLQVVTKRSTRSRVKRKLLVIDSEEEENIEEVAQTSGVRNNSKLVDIKSSKNAVVDDTANVLKHSTKRNISENTRKKKLRNVS